MAAGDRRDELNRLARVIRHPLRQRILFEYELSVNSPSKVALALNERVNVVSYHTGVLQRSGFVELVRTDRHRGAREHFYRAVMPRHIEDVEWAALPVGLRRGLARVTLDVSWREAGDALPRGGMDDATAHVSRNFLALDAQGRADLAALLRSVWREACEIERASRVRALDEPIRQELVMFSFRRSGP